MTDQSSAVISQEVGQPTGGLSPENAAKLQQWADGKGPTDQHTRIAQGAQRVLKKKEQN